MGRKSKYKSAWESNRSWLKPVHESEEKAKCTLCRSEFFITNSGLCQVKKHEETAKKLRTILPLILIMDTSNYFFHSRSM